MAIQQCLKFLHTSEQENKDEQSKFRVKMLKEAIQYNCWYAPWPPISTWLEKATQTNSSCIKHWDMDLVRSLRYLVVKPCTTTANADGNA